jgi:hypothetical protein
MGQYCGPCRIRILRNLVELGVKVQGTLLQSLWILIVNLSLPVLCPYWMKLLSAQRTLYSDVCLAIMPRLIQLRKWRFLSFPSSSPLGRNAFHCCSRYNIRLTSIDGINIQLISRLTDPNTDIGTVIFSSMIRELFEVKSGNLVLKVPEFSSSDSSSMTGYVARLNMTCITVGNSICNFLLVHNFCTIS